MALTLVDGGLPAFVWKKKRIEIPFSEAEKQKLQDLFESGLLTLEQLKKKKKYLLQDDTDANLETYRKLIRKIPNTAGRLIIGVSTPTLFKPVSLLKAEFDLRETFKQPIVQQDGSELDRFSWLKNQVQAYPNATVVFYLAAESSSTVRVS